MNKPGGDGREGAGRESAVAMSDLAGIGIQFAAVIAVFTFAGVWVDRRLGTSPIFVLLGALLGAGGGFYSMYRKLIAARGDTGGSHPIDRGGSR